MGKIKELLEYKRRACEFGCEEEDCGHLQCNICNTTAHSCAGCDADYCECSLSEWAYGANGIIYCSQECADRYGKELA
jgi:hypothetical protein